MPTLLRQKRIERKLTIAELSHELRLNASSIGSVERRQLVAGMDLRKALCSFFGIDEREAFDGGSGLAV
jgi:ribosome-binding protein aMBF1 (putative translation factor)